MVEPVQYVTNQQGERIGVLLDLETYQRLTHPSDLDDEKLVGLSVEELQALADSTLAPATQSQLSDLLAQNAENLLSPEESLIIDRLLAQIDHLNVLKARARYTLSSLESAPNLA